MEKIYEDGKIIYKYHSDEPKNEPIKKQYWTTEEIASSIQAFKWQINQWAKRFDVTPHQSKHGGIKFNHYTMKQVALFHHIKRLLLEEKYTIEGAKIQLRKAKLI